MEPKCPAAEIVHPLFSLNRDDVECRVAGNLRPARDRTTGDLVVCCDEYTRCPIWRGHKEAIWANKTVRVAESLRGRRARPLSAS